MLARVSSDFGGDDDIAALRAHVYLPNTPGPPAAALPSSWHDLSLNASPTAIMSTYTTTHNRE